MSDGYRKPHVSMEFIDASSPGVKYPTALRVQLVGHLAQIEEDQYVGGYDNDSDLIADVPSVLSGATIIEDLVTVQIVLDGNGETVDVPADSGNNWEVDTDTNVITIKSGIVDVAIDETETEVVDHTECSGAPAYDWRTDATHFADNNLSTGFSTDTEAAIGDYLLIDQLPFSAITDGSFRVTIDGTPYNVDGIDFTGVTDMDDVASAIQTALRAETSSTETVTWSTDHFVITTPSGEPVTVLETSTGTVGTDISGAGSSDWMDGDTGNGEVTAFLTGGTDAEDDYTVWAAISDASFRATIDGTGCNVDAIDFSGDLSMDDVAATIQSALRAATGSLETVVWDTDHFVITTVPGDDNSIAVLETSTGTVGTDISGAGVADWMDADTGNGTVSSYLTGGSGAQSNAIEWLGGAGNATVSAHRIVGVGATLTVEGTLPAIGDKAAGDIDSYKVVPAIHYGELNVSTNIFSDDTQEFDSEGLVTGYSQIVIYEQDGTANGPYNVSLQTDGTLLVLGSPVWPLDICVENLEYKIVMKGDGKAYVGYYALRSDLSESRLRLTPNTVATTLGGKQNIAIDNPAAINAWLTLQIADEVFISCPNESDPGAFLDNSLCDETEWANTLNHLKTYTMQESAYSFVCLAQNTQIISLLELFVDWMRDPDRHRLICGYGSFPRVSEDVVLPATAVPSGNDDTTTFTDVTQDYTVSGTIPGAYLELTSDAGTIYKRQIKTPGTGSLELYEATPDDVDTDWTYRVVNSYFTTYEEATNCKAYAQAYANRAFRLVWPESLRAIFKKEEHLVPSYMWQTYWTAMLAASESISLPHTNVGVNTFFTESVFPSAEFKDEEILDIIASGGIEIVKQDTPTSPLYSRHQLTTDMTSVNTREQSVVHQFDYAGMVLLLNFEKLVGTIELDEKGLALLKTIFTACQTFVVDKKQALRELNLTYLEVDPDSSDLILMEVEGKGRPPFNGGHIKFYMV